MACQASVIKQTLDQEPDIFQEFLDFVMRNGKDLFFETYV